MFDVVTAELRCRCGHLAPEGETSIQVHFRPSPDGSLLRVGDRVDVADPLAGPYLEIRDPARGEDIHLLESWTCPVCGAGFNWALITLRDDEWIAGVESADLTRATLDRADYVTYQLRYVYPHYTGQPMTDGARVRLDWLAVLRAALPA